MFDNFAGNVKSFFFTPGNWRKLTAIYNNCWYYLLGVGFSVYCCTYATPLWWPIVVIENALSLLFDCKARDLANSGEEGIFKTALDVYLSG